MERTATKWMVSGLCGMILVTFLILLSLDQTNKNIFINDWLTVSMPRPMKQLLMGFSLEGRSLRRELQVDKTDSQQVLKKETPNSTKALVDGKKIQAKVDAKEKYKKALEEYYFKVRIVQESERYRKALRAQAESDRQYDEFEFQTFKKRAAAESAEVKKEEALLDSNWKSLVLAQPNRENVQKMIEAHSKGEVADDTYYEIVVSLLKDNSQEKQRMGLWALTASSSTKGFTVAAHLAEETSDPALKKTMNEYLNSYNSPKGLSSLDQALRSGDSIVKAAAAQVISKGIERVKSGQNELVLTRGQRPDFNGVLTLDAYRRLIPTLRWLTSSSNTLSQWAQGLLSQLQVSGSPA